METNNYPSWLVPLDIAKKLKKIEFDTPCTFLWDSSEDSNNLRCYLDEQEGVYLPNSFNYNSSDTSGYYVYISIPTWEQAFEWFRKKDMFHSIHISEDLLHRVKFFEAEIRDKNANIICIISKLTYEEAREALINKLIELYETNINI